MLLRRILALLATLTLAAGLAAPASATSAPVFEDVPAGAAFYDDIAWLYDAGITTGVDLDGDGILEFWPSDALTVPTARPCRCPHGRLLPSASRDGHGKTQR